MNWKNMQLQGFIELPKTHTNVDYMNYMNK